MKRILAAVCIFCLLFPLSIEAKEFSIRNGIKWGMNAKEIIALMADEGYSEYIEIDTYTSAGDNITLWYKDVTVASLALHVFFVIEPSESSTNFKGLGSIMYFTPSYSMLMSHQMLLDYDDLLNAIKKKYGNPTRQLSHWKNDDYKKIYTEATAAQQGLYQRLASWEKLQDVYIEILMNDDLAKMYSSIESLKFGPTVWVAYYSKDFIKEMNNYMNKESSNDGL